jgi:dTDP-4-dehydrorhamnose 3,5-epimerase
MLLEPRVFADERGFFAETYRRSLFEDLGIGEEMVQDNHSRSTQRIVRGMHFQVGDGVAKLVRCGRGAIFDVVVDLRRGSPTFGQWEGYELSDDNFRMVYCPIGFAHGFCVLSDKADVFYKQSGYYDPALERGISFSDPEVGIDWPIPVDQMVGSERDIHAPRLSEVADELPFEYS